MDIRQQCLSVYAGIDIIIHTMVVTSVSGDAVDSGEEHEGG